MTGERQLRHSGKARLKERCALLLVTKGSIKSIAEELKIQEGTIYKWKRQPEFQQMIAAARQQLMKETTNALIAASLDSVGVLKKIADSDVAPEAARVSAARSVLDFAVRTGLIAELEQRLAQLESGESDES